MTASKHTRNKPTTHLRKWLSSNKISDGKFAAQMTRYRGNRRRVFATDVNRWATGAYVPGGITREEIEVVSNWNVPVTSWPTVGGR